MEGRDYTEGKLIIEKCHLLSVLYRDASSECCEWLSAAGALLARMKMKSRPQLHGLWPGP